MFPEKSGGLALYAHEAWRKYTTLVGPIATFGYWIGWSVVLSVNGLFVGSIIQVAWFAERAGRELPRRRRLLLRLGLTEFGLPAAIAIGLILAVWLFNVFGDARRRHVRLHRGRAADDPALRDDDPPVPERQLRQREPHEQPQRRRASRGAASSSRSSGSG